MKSFNRLRCLNRAVFDLIDEINLKNAIVADIATDHGYLAELISRNEKVLKVYATDISRKCLEKADELKKRCNLKKIETRLGDGLDPIDCVDLVVVAGIGGYEIIRMIDVQNIKSDGERKCNYFILQPTKNVVELRSYLIDKKFEIIRDYIVYSGGKFYPIIIVDLSKKSVIDKSMFNLHFGKSNNVKNCDFVRYLKMRIEELKFVKKLKREDFENSNDLKTKLKIYELAKKLINESEGE